MILFAEDWVFVGAVVGCAALLAAVAMWLYGRGVG